MNKIRFAMELIRTCTPLAILGLQILIYYQ
jgi:hypothetical protein